MFQRRQLLAAGLTSGLMPSALWAAEPDADAALRAGGLVLAFRHAIAPGTFDPPQFKLGDCTTQRNLSDEGREQARRIGVWFKKPIRRGPAAGCCCRGGAAPAGPAQHLKRQHPGNGPAPEMAIIRPCTACSSSS